MGRQRVLNTYGNHRKRVVVASEANIFESPEKYRDHLFSTSSSESGFGLGESGDSVEVSSSFKKTESRFNNNRKKTDTDKGGEPRKTCKRKRQGGRRGVLFSSDKDTNSSSDCFTPISAKRVQLHVLHDVANGINTSRKSKRQTTKRSTAVNKRNAATNGTCKQISIDFSEFDDYSLVISDSLDRSVKDKEASKDKKTGLGTSTPCDGHVRRLKPCAVELSSADISVIECDAGQDEAAASFSVSDPVPRCDSSLSVFSLQSIQENVDKSDSTDRKNMKRLEESFSSVWVSGRRLRQRRVQPHKPSSVDSGTEAGSAVQTPDHVTGSVCRNTSVEDCLALECKMRVQKLRVSLIKSFAASESLQSSFNASDELFDSPAELGSKLLPDRKCKKGTDSQEERSSGSSDSDEWSSESLEEEDLSAIVEDGEEEEEVEEQSDPEEEKSGEDEDTVDEDDFDSNISKAERLEGPADLSDPALDKSDVCYMLTSLSLADVDLPEEDIDTSMSILNQSGKKSLGIDLSCSFAEILTPIEADIKSGDRASPRQKVLEQCCQDEPIPFLDVIPATALKNCVKIGEGVYGEVFRTKHRGQSVALKIIPIEGDFTVNDEPQKTFQEMLPEIVISNELSQLCDAEENNTTNFCAVKSVSLVQGCYPEELLKQWDVFNEKKKSENDRPDIFEDEQLYIIFEFVDGGTDLDGFKLQNGHQAVSLLKQAACALAVAEEVLQFEHRDLHCGNVLVQPTQQATVTVTLHGNPVFVDTQGIHVSIIDFTLSRLTKDGCTVYCDLATDETLFQGKGDYQFEIYRMMRQENKNNWRAYHPHTNIMWLHYLCDKLLHKKRYKNRGRSHRDALKMLRQTYDILMDYGSAAHFVMEDSLFHS